MSPLKKFGGLFLIFAVLILICVYFMENTRVDSLKRVAQEDKEFNERNKTKTPVTPVAMRNRKINIGDTAKEIKLNSPDGKEYSLSSLRGKYVLIDFWASWCGPCRKENPALVKTYNKYKSLLVKNQYEFTIFSVSLDEKVDAWKAAIAKDQLEWPYHVSNLAGWSCKTAEAYGVEGIPSNFLLDNNGKVIKINLRGEELDKALSEIK